MVFVCLGLKHTEHKRSSGILHLVKEDPKSPYVDLLVITLLGYHLRRQVFWSSAHCVGFDSVLCVGGPKVCQFDLSLLQKNILEFQVTMDDRWSPPLEIEQSFCYFSYILLLNQKLVPLQPLSLVTQQLWCPAKENRVSLCRPTRGLSECSWHPRSSLRT